MERCRMGRGMRGIGEWAGASGRGVRLTLGVGCRMHVLKGTDSTDPTRPFEDQGQIGTPDENYAIDVSVVRVVVTVLYLTRSWIGHGTT